LIKSIFYFFIFDFAVSFQAQHNRPLVTSCQRLRGKRLQRYEELSEKPNIFPIILLVSRFSITFAMQNEVSN